MADKKTNHRSGSSASSPSLERPYRGARPSNAAHRAHRRDRNRARRSGLECERIDGAVLGVMGVRARQSRQFRRREARTRHGFAPRLAPLTVLRGRILQIPGEQRHAWSVFDGECAVARNVRELGRADAHPSCRAAIVVEQPAETRTTENPAIAPGRRRAVDAFIAESRMMAFAMVVLDELVQGPPEVALPYRNHAVEAFVLDGSYDAPRVCMAVRCVVRRLHHAHPRFFQQVAQRCAPLLVPVADQHPAAGQRSSSWPA